MCFVLKTDHLCNLIMIIELSIFYNIPIYHDRLESTTVEEETMSDGAVQDFSGIASPLLAALHFSHSPSP
jgi:hypothetical protein